MEPFGGGGSQRPCRFLCGPPRAVWPVALDWAICSVASEDDPLPTSEKDALPTSEKDALPTSEDAPLPTSRKAPLLAALDDPNGSPRARRALICAAPSIVDHVPLLGGRDAAAGPLPVALCEALKRIHFGGSPASLHAEMKGAHEEGSGRGGLLVLLDGSLLGARSEERTTEMVRILNSARTASAQVIVVYEDRNVGPSDLAAMSFYGPVTRITYTPNDPCAYTMAHLDRGGQLIEAIRIDAQGRISHAGAARRA